MGETTKIAWAGATWNPWWGCTEVSDGCNHCYAEGFANRLALDVWGKHSPRRFFGEKHWNEPLRWSARRVFCASMCDILEDRRDLDSSRERLWKLIESTPQLTWMLLTKRPQNYSRMLPSWWLDSPLPNVWIMTTVESPEHLWRLREIAKIRAVVHGVSWEPGLAYVDFKPFSDVNGLWVIGGGESGVGCRPFDLEWARRVRDDCRQSGRAYFLKQLGGHPFKQDDPSLWPSDLRVQEFPNHGRIER